jgi:hypothetical protein
MFGVMKALAIFLALTVVALASGGCMRTYISTGAPGIQSADGRTRLCLTSHGAWCHAYIDKSRKLVDVWIGPVSTNDVMFSHRYKFVGSDLDWHIHWSSPEAVTVDLFDYGEGVLASAGRKTGAPSNHIATLEFQMDKQSGKFVERKP